MAKRNAIEFWKSEERYKGCDERDREGAKVNDWHMEKGCQEMETGLEGRWGAKPSKKRES